MTAATAKTETTAIGVDIEVVAPHWLDVLPEAEATCRAAAAAAWLAADTDFARAIAAGDAEVSLRLTDDEEVAALNRAYRDRDGPTNVLSFAALSAPELAALPQGAPVLLGDVVVALGVARTEAGAQEKTLGDHLSHLVVHGMLHLLGYDHIEEHDAEVMEALETTVLGTLGVADPYADIGPAPDTMTCDTSHE